MNAAAYFAPLYDCKTPVAAADLLNDRVIPFVEEREIPLSRILTDRGAKYCGTPEPALSRHSPKPVVIASPKTVSSSLPPSSPSVTPLFNLQELVGSSPA